MDEKSITEPIGLVRDSFFYLLINVHQCIELQFGNFRSDVHINDSYGVSVL